MKLTQISIVTNMTIVKLLLLFLLEVDMVIANLANYKLWEEDTFITLDLTTTLLRGNNSFYNVTQNNLGTDTFWTT